MNTTQAVTVNEAALSVQINSAALQQVTAPAAGYGQSKTFARRAQEFQAYALAHELVAALYRNLATLGESTRFSFAICTEGTRVWLECAEGADAQAAYKLLTQSIKEVLTAV